MQACKYYHNERRCYIYPPAHHQPLPSIPRQYFTNFRTSPISITSSTSLNALDPLSAPYVSKCTSFSSLRLSSCSQEFLVCFNPLSCPSQRIFSSHHSRSFTAGTSFGSHSFFNKLFSHSSDETVSNDRLAARRAGRKLSIQEKRRGETTL